MGNISSVSPTATATAKSKGSNQISFVSPLMMKTSATITRSKPNIT
jgi:hypothetical protein